VKHMLHSCSSPSASSACPGALQGSPAPATCVPCDCAGPCFASFASACSLEAAAGACACCTTPFFGGGCEPFLADLVRWRRACRDLRSFSACEKAY
jgi:hypothetical protein